MIKRILIVTLLLLLVITNAEAAKNITDCGTISLPGSYVLNTNIDNGTANTCITIASNNVLLDGGNYRINGSSIPGSVGVFVFNNTVPVLQNIKVTNLSVSNWTVGIRFVKTQNSIIENNAVRNNSFGFYIQESRNITLNDNMADANLEWDFYSTKVQENSVNRLILKPNNTIITFKGENLSLKEAYPPAPDPGKFSNIGYFVLAENLTENSWLNLTVHYKHSDVPPLGENTLRMYRYNGTWTSADEPNKVDTTGNTVYGNTTSFGIKGFYIFAPMGLDITDPVINSVTLDNYAPNTGDPITVTVDATDNAAVVSVEANSISLVAQGGNIWNGTITAIGGTHSVNVSAGDAAGNVVWDNTTSYTATTPAPILTTIEITPLDPTLIVGGSQAFTATGYDQYGVSIATSPAWTSSDTAVGTIDPVTGAFMAVSAGTTTVTATDGSVSGTSTVTVNLVPAALTTIEVSPLDPTLTVGDTQIFSASGFDQYGTSFPTTPSWSSSNLSVGTIDPVTGDLTAVAEGTTTVTATDGSVSGTSTVTVNLVPAALTTIEVSPLDPTLTVGDTPTFTASGFDQYGAPIATSPAWTSSDTAVGTIDPVTGAFMAVSAGTTTVTATDGIVSNTSNVTVSLPPPVLTTIEVTPANITMLARTVQTFTATGYDQYGALIDTSVTWSRSDPSVGTIDVETGEFTAVAAGTTTITATDGSVVGTTTVRVRDSDLSGFTGDATARRGGLLNTSVTVTNLAATAQNYTIEVSGVTASGDPLVGTGTLVNLGPGQSLNVPVLVAIPSAAAAGDYTLLAALWKYEDFPASDRLIITSAPLTVTIT